MVFYICCTQNGNDCPKKEECRRYEHAKEEVSWSLFKYICTEDNDYNLFMEKVEDNISTKNETKEIDQNEETE